MKMLGMVPIEDIRSNRWNVNELTKEDEARLREQMRLSGPERTEPVIVRRAAEGKWELINGEQRWRVAKQLGWKALPAVEFEEGDEEAIRLCISFNALRGEINIVRLAKLAAEDERVYRAYALIYGEKEAEKLVESVKRLTPEAEEQLATAVKEGTAVTPEGLEFVAKMPETHQAYIAKAVKKGDLQYARAVAEEYGLVPRSKGPVDQEKLREFLKSEEEKGEKAPVERHLKAAVVESEVEIKEPGRYRIFYNPENKTVGIKSVAVQQVEGELAELEHEIEAKMPKLMVFEVKCKCGNAMKIEVNVETGECRVA